MNDVATSGARVRYLSCGFVLEEGYPLADLKRICASMAATAQEAGVAIITGDTKVVGRGKADGIFINTAGVGEVPAGVALSGANAQPGDVVLVSGTMGDHGIAIMSTREGLSFSTDIESDVAPLNHLVAGGARGGTPCALLPRSHARRTGKHLERVRSSKRRRHRAGRGSGSR